ncbi:MAG: phosphatase PAP2 family protein [Ruminococcaceae bacterium]|nr:phosphatase PAP2 family protein [Oscillospiraceae bacterium]
MKMRSEKNFITAGVLMILFLLLTILVQIVDVKPLGVNGTNIGFSTVNCCFHGLTGVNMVLYHITDWLGLVPLIVCLIFAGVGFIQAIKRRSVFLVDYDILLLGLYYLLIFFCYTVFESIPINYRPVLINGVQEASYPSSTTLLVMGIMPTLQEQVRRRVKRKSVRDFICVFAVVFSMFMVIGRAVCGVHWLTDIVGSLLFCGGLFHIYKAFILLLDKRGKVG